jgi:phospholipid N-methyltransferase
MKPQKLSCYLRWSKMDRSLFKRPDKPLVCARPNFDIKAPVVDIKQPKLISVDSSTECHTTPSSIAARMVDYLDIQPATLTTASSSILEPHGGTGQLVQALLDRGVLGGWINTVELNHKLCDFMSERFQDSYVNINQGSIFDDHFDSFVQKYDRIICNPPFRSVVKHIDRIYSFLSIRGVAICLVPIAYKKIEHKTLEVLSAETFLNCQVDTKIIQICV